MATKKPASVNAQKTNAVSKKLTLQLMKLTYIKARKAYEAGNYIMSDEAYDELEKEIRKQEPDWVELEKTSFNAEKVGKKVKVTLPVAMPSLDKLWADQPAKVERWVGKALKKSPTQELVGTPKLDGSAVQTSYTNGKLTQLATKGDGITGQSFMHLAPYLPKLLKTFPTSFYLNLTLRMEAIIDNKDFERHLSEEFDTSRAAVAGMLNRTKPHPGMKYIQFIVLKVLDAAPKAVPLLADQVKGLQTVQKLGFHVVPSHVFKEETANAETFSRRTAIWRSQLPFDQDGLALTTRGHYEKPTQGKPDWSAAFKNNSQSEVHTTTVEELIWQPSKAGKLIPKLRIKPVKFNGTTVTYCAASSAQRCKDRGWGPGAVVKVRRSGDIIPEVVETLKPGKFTLPTGTAAYHWNGIHLQLADNLSEEVRGKQLHATATSLGMEFLAVKSFVKYAGFVGQRPQEFLKALYKTPKKLAAAMEQAGLSPVVVSKFMATRPEQPTLVQLIIASNLMGESYGSRMVEKMLTLKSVDWYKDVKAVQDDLAEPDVAAAFVDLLGPTRGPDMLIGAQAFYKWYAHFPEAYKGRKAKVVKVKQASQALAGVCASWTGYRDKDQEQTVIENGGTVVPFGSKTTVLFYKADGKASTKVDKAKAQGKETSANFARWFKTSV